LVEANSISKYMYTTIIQSDNFYKKILIIKVACSRIIFYVLIYMKLNYE